MIAATADIVEEVELAQTLLSQGHLETAQKVLLKICQEQPEVSRAFRVLAEVLRRRGDDNRRRILVEYADELDAQKTAEIEATVEDSSSDADTHQTHWDPHPGLTPLPMQKIPEKQVRQLAPFSAHQTPLTLPTPTQNPIVFLGPQTSSPALSSAQMPRVRRRGLAVLFVLLGAVLTAGAVVGYTVYGRGNPAARPSAREELDRSLVSGALEVLMRARELARMELESRTPNADDLVRLGLVNALLVCDYAMDASKDADEALKRADGIPAPSNERLALAATARALLALAAGDRPQARMQADMALAANAPDVPAFALLASARVRTVAGDAEGAAKDLDRALIAGPEILPVVVDWAASRIEAGDPVVARRTLLAMLGRSPDNSRARLFLADAERALGEPDWTKRLDTACASDSKISRTVRSVCAVESALQTRLEGDRAGALRKAKAIAQSTDEPMLLGQLSLLLALLGEIDTADEVLQRAAKGADPATVSLQWASFAIRLGRGEILPAHPLLEHPAGPERDLVALRAAYGRSGKSGLGAMLKSLPPGILDVDWDVRAMTVLAHEAAPSKPELMVLEKKGEKGNPVATYVLGLLAFQDGDFKLAVRRFDRSLALHGDACRAATLYLEAFKSLGRGAIIDKVGLRSVRARNVKCPLPEM